MKLFFAVTLLAIASCNNVDKKGNINMRGAYKMLSQSYKTAKLDTTNTSVQQFKIYTADYMMYAHFNPANASASFGIGSYTVDKDTVTENVFYNGSDSTKDDNLHSYKLGIEKTASGYKQAIPNILFGQENITLIEKYETVNVIATSPLDGAWKLVKAYSIKGNDTIPDKITQFKIYGSGNFIFGHTYSDSSNKMHTGMGYGTFTMIGNTKSKETVTVSTYTSIRGQEVDIDIELKGADEFKQMIVLKDGSKLVEEYQRLKK